MVKPLYKLSRQYNFAKSTISRHLKIDLGDKEYKEILNILESRNSSFLNREINVSNRLHNIQSKETENKEFLKTIFYMY